MNLWIIALLTWLAPAGVLGVFLAFSVARDSARRASHPLEEHFEHARPKGSAENNGHEVPAGSASL